MSNLNEEINNNLIGVFTNQSAQAGADGNLTDAEIIEALDSVFEILGYKNFSSAVADSRGELPTKLTDVFDHLINATQGALDKALGTSISLQEKERMKEQDFGQKLAEINLAMMKAPLQAQTSVASFMSGLGTFLKFIPGLEGIGNALVQKAEELSPQLQDSADYKGLDEIKQFMRQVSSRPDIDNGVLAEGMAPQIESYRALQDILEQAKDNPAVLANEIELLAPNPNGAVQ